MIRGLVWLPIKLTLLAGIFVACGVGGSVGYHQFAPATKTCLTCHAAQHQDDRAAMAAHRHLACSDCHSDGWYAGLHGADQHARALFGAIGTDASDPRKSLRATVLRTHDSCRRCHPNHFENWLAGGHSLSCADFLLDQVHNGAEQLNEDCLRCHGMFFDGPIEEAVQPLSVEGPWRLKQPALADEPAIPCAACHRMHAEPGRHDDSGRDLRVAGQRQAEYLGSVGLYSRNEQTWFALRDLPQPKIQQEGRPVEISRDPLVRNCVQCHAPDSFQNAGSSDDRTPLGVHAGISCLACHRTHARDARDSCAACHPKISNCGLDVTRMDTTFADPNSIHDIHTVGCGDCHPQTGD